MKLWLPFLKELEQTFHIRNNLLLKDELTDGFQSSVCIWSLPRVRFNQAIVFLLHVGGCNGEGASCDREQLRHEELGWQSLMGLHPASSVSI